MTTARNRIKTCSLFAIALSFAHVAGAVGISVLGPNLSPDGFDIYTFAMDIPAGDENTFDTFEFAAIGNLNQSPTGGDGAFITGESSDSGFFAELTAPTTFGGNDLVPFGINSSSDTTGGIFGVFASLGSNAASGQGNIQIAQAAVPTGTGGLFRYGFFNDGITVGEGQGEYGTPLDTYTNATVNISGPSLSPSGLDTYKFSLDLPFGEADSFDTIQFVTDGNFNQSEIDRYVGSVPSDDSGFRRTVVNNTPNGLTFSNIFRTTDSKASIAATIERSGSYSLPSPPDIGEFGQVVVPTNGGGTYEAVFHNFGFEVGRVSGTYGDPSVGPPPPIDPPPVDPPPVDPPPVDPPPVDPPPVDPPPVDPSDPPSRYVFGGFAVDGPSPSPSGQDTYTFSLDLPSDLIGAFDTFEFSANGDLNQDPTGGDGSLIPFANASDDSGFFAWLRGHGASFGTLDLSIFGVDATTDTEDSISGTFASLGSNRASEVGNYAVAQVVVPTGGDGTFEFTFFNDGAPVGGGSGIFTDESQTPEVVVTESVLLDDGTEMLILAVQIPDSAAGSFDTFELVVEGDLVQDPTQAGDLLSSGEQDSGFIDLLSAPASFGGRGLSTFGVDASSDTNERFSGTFASLGSNAASEQGDYAIAQLIIPVGSEFQYSFAFFDDGAEVAAGNAIRGFIPEPGSLALLVLSTACLPSLRRYSPCHTKLQANNRRDGCKSGYERCAY